MKANERKIQILSLLQEKPLSLQELRDRARIKEKHLNALTWKYRKQKLIRRTSDTPVMMELTVRGRARLLYLTLTVNDFDDRIDTVPAVHRSSSGD